MMEKVAVIGTGIAGMSAAYFLKNQFDITFFERNNYAGGHTNTVSVKEQGTEVFIDTAFMVYNEVTYPNLTKLLAELKVNTKPTSMSFSVQHVPTGLEYRGTGFKHLFCQRRNIFNIPFIRMLLEVDRFSKEADEVLNTLQYQNYSLSQYTREKKYSEDFLMKFLVPMSSAVWSMGPGLMLEFPVVTLVRFFKNHGFLGLKTQHQWYTIDGGSRMYRDKIMDFFKGKVGLNQAAQKLVRQDNKIIVEDQHHQQHSFDKVIVACHADEALGLWEHPSKLEEELLKHFPYQKNKTTLHTDHSVMPKLRGAWSSWNYRMGVDNNGDLQSTTIYHMNSLQQVSQNQDYFVSINDPGLVDPGKILWETEYTHPIYNVQSLKAQKKLYRLNTQGGVYYCGSYFKYGFHEDALTSGIEVVKAMTGRYPGDYRGFRV
jgi:predicted NAD/FAD-binding protein